MFDTHGGGGGAAYVCLCAKAHFSPHTVSLENRNDGGRQTLLNSIDDISSQKVSDLKFAAQKFESIVVLCG